MNRFCAASISSLVAAAASAMPPEPVPIARGAAPHGSVNDRYFDDVEGLARLTWQATQNPDVDQRLAAVEQMARVCTHPRRVDAVLATIESKEPHPIVKQAALRVRVQLRQETANMKWVESENEIGKGRSVVAHDPIPYREALASLRTTPGMTNVAPCPTCGPTTNDVMPMAYSKSLSRSEPSMMPTTYSKSLTAQQRWASSVAAARKANAQNLPTR
jgi:hypothetical protein